MTRICLMTNTRARFGNGAHIVRLVGEWSKFGQIDFKVAD